MGARLEEADDGRIRKEPNALKPQDEFVKGSIKFVRRDVEGVRVMMGKSSRSAITGEVAVRNLEYYPDFTFVDLARRPGGELNFDTCYFAADKYLYKPVPLMYRTWLYHSMIGASTILGGKHDEHQMIRHVLSLQCIDAPVIGGRGSPLTYFVPLAIGICLTGNWLLVLFTLFIICVLLATEVLMNSPEYYRYSRPVTLPIRILFLIVILVSFDAGDVLKLVGFLLTLLAEIGDFLTGDVAAVLSLKLTCSYEILHYLGRRVCICYRHGGFGMEESFGDRGRVDEAVSQMAVWERQHHIIADIGDLLVELRPLSANDWLRLRNQYCITSEPIPYLALDIFPIDGAEGEDASPAGSSPGKPRREASDMVLEDL